MGLTFKLEHFFPMFEQFRVRIFVNSCNRLVLVPIGVSVYLQMQERS